MATWWFQPGVAELYHREPGRYPAGMQPDDESVATAWRESAPYWERHRDHLRAMFAPVTDSLLDSAAIGQGHRVLDVACGSGEPTFSIADAVGSGGSVIATDVVEEMVASVRRESGRIAAGHVRTAVCSAVSLPFCDASFDRAVSRFGAMFFPDAAAAARELTRVTRPGGRVALVVWGSRDRNPYFWTASDVLARFVPTEPEPADSPNAFRYAEPDALAGILRGAGLVDVVEALLPFTIELPLEFDAFWQMRVELSDSLREKMARLDPATRTVANEAARELTAPYFPAGTMRFPSEVLVVSGSRAWR